MNGIAPETAIYSPAQLARLLGLPEPTAEQAAVIGAPLRPMVVAAGAGSGKSETMAARVVWLVANGLVRPEHVLGLTFTRKAAAELCERVRRRLDGLRHAGLDWAAMNQPDANVPDMTPAAASRALAGPPGGAGSVDDVLAGEPTVCTYHAYAGRLVADHALREALEPSLRLITPAVQWQIATKVVAGYGGPVDKINWTPASVTAAVLELAGEMAEHLRTAREVVTVGERLAAQAAELPLGRGGRPSAVVAKILATQQTREQLLPMVEAFSAAKAAREVIDYGDQISLAATIAVRHPAVGVAERARYQVVLLDEYQDTSHAQLVLLRALFAGGHPVTAVGDPCQSIYGWRGASAGNLRRFRADFATGPGRAQTPQLALLSTSFRNSKRILDVAAKLQDDLRAEAAEVPRLVPAPERAGRGMTACALLLTAADEAAWVTERLTQVLSLPPGVAPDGKRWPDGRGDRVRPGDVAVLCRKRSQFPALRRAMEDRGIPIEVVGLGGLLTVPEVQDVVATLRVLHDPAASDAVARLLTGPRWRIGPADLVALGRRARELARQARSAQQPTAASNGPGRPAEHTCDAQGVSVRESARLCAGAGPCEPPRGASPGGWSPGPPGASPAGRTPGPPGVGIDPVSEAIADMTAEPASLVEALDDLGDPAAYSHEGHMRLAALAGELRMLRGQVGQPLPDLVLEIERALGLDIEVAARPGADPAAARADLDAFADAADAFAGDEEQPTLAAFLSYLTAAEAEEFGLEAGRVGETDSVKLMTVHAAKGLQWPVVFVPGLCAGEKAQLFPAKPRVSTRWTDNPRKLPFVLRGDAVDLPGLAGLDTEAVDEFTSAAKLRDLREERRLAYVAATRAAFWLGCSGYWWGDGLAPLGPSVFLSEVRAACEEGAGQVSSWVPTLAEGAENPVLAHTPAAPWPAAPSGSRYEATVAAAALVERDLAQMSPGRSPARAAAPTEASPGSAATPAAVSPGSAATPAVVSPASAGSPVTHGPATSSVSPRFPSSHVSPGEHIEQPDHSDLTEPGGLSAADEALIVAWTRDATLLLAERAARRGHAAIPVDLPSRLSVSSLVSLAADPGEYARWVRRPLPRPPAPQARRGTAFHSWLEARFGQQHLIDPDDLPGAADEGAEAADAELAQLRARFEAGEWASRVPAEVEVPFETLIADRLVRGRIDAVFADSRDGGFDVVDWKTGRPARTGAESRAVAVQLAAYRLAWAGLAGVPLRRVRAAFYYVRDDLTVRPADMLDAAGLEALITSIPPAGRG